MHIRRLPSHGWSPFRSCPRLVLLLVGLHLVYCPPNLDPGGYAVVNQQWRYIHYSDDIEELYDVRKDPNEKENLEEDDAYTAVKQELAANAPDTFAPVGIPKKQRNLVFEGDAFQWQAK